MDNSCVFPDSASQNSHLGILNASVRPECSRWVGSRSRYNTFAKLPSNRGLSQVPMGNGLGMIFQLDF